MYEFIAMVASKKKPVDVETLSREEGNVQGSRFV